MNCIIVDDSLTARKAILLLITQVDFLNVKKECSSSLEAFNFLNTEEIDLVFLDIEMPDMSGFELIKNLKKAPIIILITSTKDYAAEAFELNVADYLIKPVTLSRFVAAVDRAKEMYDSTGKKIETDAKDDDHLFVSSNTVLTKIKLDHILYIKALGDYIAMYSLTKRDVVHCDLKSFEEKLPINKFSRVHRSYIVAINHIDKVEQNEVHIGQQIIPITDQYKKDLLEKINLI